ncbi:unnamed protein product [Vitrella brassicaformis CCMP3155]|uniref:Uncharacterized protein n=1 Tax=Vitrella brassicaformis (strain CCMP3155) TaxID=1169540 RepID=A0A0G4G9M3_VITBC|nr:unnamed protein product [Vitrella brassicaformis CCMP3155]|eukprot:CEM25664.1 unnamed protein product [Vitrella brassicaformis CCMP3155]
MWTFPALEDCRAPFTPTPLSLKGLTHIVSSSPQLTTLAVNNISDCGSPGFIAALGKSMRLTTIRGLHITERVLKKGHLAELQRSLDTHWSKEDMRDEFVFDCPIDHNFGDLTRPLHTFLEWARRVGATVEWRSVACVTVDCSKEPSTVFPAVRGPVADVVNQLAKQAEEVLLMCGGTPLDESWKDVLNFPNVTQLWIGISPIHDGGQRGRQQRLFSRSRAPRVPPGVSGVRGQPP